MQEVANTILTQLGGRNRLSAMINARDFVYSAGRYGNGALQFRFSGSRKAHIVEISLDGQDTYTVRFIKQGSLAKNFEIAEAGRFDCVYASDLKSLIERHTGLRLSI